MASASWFWSAAAASRRLSSLSSSSSMAFAAGGGGGSGGTSTVLMSASWMMGSSALLLAVMPSSTSTTATTDCESAATAAVVVQQAYQDQHPKKAVALQPRMTSMGRFAWLSETEHNPSVPTFVVALVGAPFTTRDFEQAWQRREMSQRHARFDQCLGYPTSTWSASSSRIDFCPTPHSSLVQNHVTETILPSLYRTDIQDRLLEVLTTPYPVFERLWNVQISSGGVVGQSGIISKALAKSILEDTHPTTTLSLASSSSSSTSRLFVPPPAAPPTESLIVFSAHHALADGVSLSAAFTELCDEGPELQAMIQQEWQQRKSQRRRQRRQQTWWQALQHRVRSLLEFLWSCLQALGYQVQLWLESPRHNPLQDLVQPTTITSRRGRSSSRRTLSWSQVASVDEMKRVAQFFGDKVTVNDLMVSCVSAAIAKLMQHHRQHLSIVQRAKKNMETMEDDDNNINNSTTMTMTSNTTKAAKFINVAIPVHLGGGVLVPGQSLGNKIGAMLARIPCETDEEHNLDSSSSSSLSSVQRLQQIHSILGRVKQSPAALISYAMARTLASPPVSWILPSSWMTSLMTNTHLGATCVITNVRGPPHELHLGGRRVVTAQPFLPLPPGIPIGVALFSYAGAMNVSVNAEAWAVPNADQFLLWVVEEYQRLLDIASRS